MKSVYLIISLIWCLPVLSAKEPKQIRTVYATLAIEELAMRFRFPNRYMDCDRGEPAPRDMALSEMLRRKKLQRDTAMDDVAFLLGKPSIEDGFTVKVLDDGRVEWTYGMMGGGLSIIFDSKGGVSEILQHHDGEPESAHADNLLDSKPKKTEQDGGGNALKLPTHPSTAPSKSRATP